MRKLKRLFLILLFAAPAFAQNVRVDNVTFSSVQGFPFLPGATITICTAAGAGTPCAPTVAGTCLSISDATCNQSPTITADAFGNYGFWIQPGSYTYTVTKAGFGGFGPRPLTLPCIPSGVCPTPQSFTNLTVGGAGTLAKTNGVCNVDGTTNGTLAAAVTCAGSNGVVDIPMFAVPTLTAGVTIPAGVTLKFEGSSPGLVQLGNFNLTINGALIAPPVQLFSYTGSGTVSFGATSLVPEIYPQWFSGADLGAQCNNAVGAAPAQGGVLRLIAGTYTMSSSCLLGNAAVGNSKTIVLKIEGGTLINITESDGGTPFRIPNRSGIFGQSRAGDTNGVELLLGASANIASAITNSDTAGGQAFAFITGLMVQGNATATVSNALIDLNNLGVQSNVNDILVFNQQHASTDIGIRFKNLQGLHISNLWANQNSNNIDVEDSFNLVFVGTTFAENAKAASGYNMRFFKTALGGQASGMVNTIQALHIEYVPALTDTQDALLIDGMANISIQNYSSSNEGTANPMAQAIRTANTNGGATTPPSFQLCNFKVLAGGLTNIITDGVQNKNFATANFGSQIPDCITNIGSSTSVGASGRYIYGAPTGANVEIGVWHTSGGNAPYTFGEDSGGILHMGLRGSDQMQFLGSSGVRIPNGSNLQFTEETAPSAFASNDVCYGDSTLHALKCSYNNGTFFQIPQVITATSAAFATATTAGTCVQNGTAVTGATTSMTVLVSPVSTPGVGAVWSAFVSSAGNVTINECAVATSVGGTIAFNIRVIP